MAGGLHLFHLFHLYDYAKEINIVLLNICIITLRMAEMRRDGTGEYNYKKERDREKECNLN